MLEESEECKEGKEERVGNFFGVWSLLFRFFFYGFVGGLDIWGGGDDQGFFLLGIFRCHLRASDRDLEDSKNKFKE